MEIVILIILILLFILEISYTIKNKLSQTVIAVCTLLFIFDLLVIFTNFPHSYEGASRNEFSSEIAFFIGKLAYYMGQFVFLELAIIISNIIIN